MLAGLPIGQEHYNSANILLQSSDICAYTGKLHHILQTLQLNHDGNDCDSVHRGDRNHQKQQNRQESDADLMLKKGTSASPATALASKVLPVPGGPTSSTPEGARAPSLLNFSGLLSNSCNSLMYVTLIIIIKLFPAHDKIGVCRTSYVCVLLNLTCPALLATTGAGKLKSDLSIYMACKHGP